MHGFQPSNHGRVIALKALTGLLLHTHQRFFSSDQLLQPMFCPVTSGIIAATACFPTLFDLIVSFDCATGWNKA